MLVYLCVCVCVWVVSPHCDGLEVSGWHQHVLHEEENAKGGTHELCAPNNANDSLCVCWVDCKQQASGKCRCVDDQRRRLPPQ